MALSAVAQVIQYAILPWLFLLFAVVMLKILRGDINNVGLLRSKRGAPIEPDRVTMLGTSLFAIGAYAADVMHTGAIPDPKTGLLVMPDAPEMLLVLLAGGNGLYLAGKLMRR